VGKVDETTIDGWRCQHWYPGEEWSFRTAARGTVEFYADHDGLSVDESSSSWMGASGKQAIPANVFMWLSQAVR
jgi:hypothetical protein